MTEGNMKKLFFATISLVFLLGIGGIANATNGDNFMGIGPISRAMGGVGIAAPQDSISAVFANPAGMCFGPYCPGSQLDFAGTLFFPTVHGSVETPGGTFADRSQSNLFLVPAIGLSTPITSDSTSFFSKFRFGLAAYGASGMGTDYRNRLFGPASNGADIFTQYQVFKFAPNIAYRITDNFSIGVNFQLDYTGLDLGQGTSSGFGFGGQIGFIYKLGPVSFGLSYVSPQSVEHKRVSSFGNSSGPKQDLTLEMPQTVGLGIAFQPAGNLLLKDDNLLIEGNFKWINWANARGYKDFDWRDQYVFAFGVQYKPIPKLALRLGVNYGQNPVKTHNGFDGSTTTNVQGISVNTGQYEYLRIVGFPAIVETHLTCGIGYDFSERFGVNIGYTHGFAKSISESGTNFDGPPAFPVTLGSKLAEDSIDVGLTWRF
jgi:long-chain fatty acid transport protein